MPTCLDEALRFAMGNSSMSRTLVCSSPKEKSYSNIKALTGIEEWRCQPRAALPVL